RNYRGVILDLVLTTISDTTVFPATETIVPIDVNHPPLAFCISLQKIDIPLNPTPCHNLKKCDLDAVWEWIQRQNYPTISSCNVIKNFTSFCENLAEVIKLNSPLKRTAHSLDGLVAI
ncbi:hypothetical protein J6590_107952, partial [Homalodisca vitripennis]